MVRVQDDFFFVGVFERLAARDRGGSAFSYDAGAAVEAGEVAAEDCGLGLVQATPGGGENEGAYGS